MRVLKCLYLLNSVLRLYQCQATPGPRSSTIRDIELRLFFLTRCDLVRLRLRHIWFFFDEGQTLSQPYHRFIIEGVAFQNFRIDPSNIMLDFRSLSVVVIFHLFIKVKSFFEWGVKVYFLRTYLLIVKIFLIVLCSWQAHGKISFMIDAKWFYELICELLSFLLWNYWS